MSQPDREAEFYTNQARHVRQCWKEARFVGWTWLISLARGGWNDWPVWLPGTCPNDPRSRRWSGGCRPGFSGACWFPGSF